MLLPVSQHGSNQNVIMKQEGTARFVLRIVRNVLLADLILATLVGIACYVFDLRTYEAYGTLLVWVGWTLIILACLTGIGGFASRTHDVAAYSRSGAGNMTDNLRQITDARSSNLGCFLHLILIGVGLLALGNLLQILPFLF